MSLIPDPTMQAALSQLTEAGFWESGEDTILLGELQSRIVGAVKLHQPTPELCSVCRSEPDYCGHSVRTQKFCFLCGGPWPCDTHRILVNGIHGSEHA